MGRDLTWNSISVALTGKGVHAKVAFMLAVRQRFQPVLGLVRWLTVPMLLLLSLGGCAKSPDETADLSDVPAGSHSHELPGDALVSTAEISARQAKQREALNPSYDGWSSEAFSDSAQNQLHQLLQLREANTELFAKQLAAFVTDDFQCGRLRPEHLRDVFNGDGLRVSRAATESTEVSPNGGPVALADALQDLGRPLAETTERRDKVKTIRAELSDAGGATTHIVEIYTQGDNATAEHHMVWRCRWRRDDQETLRLSSLYAEAYVEAVFSGTHKTWFTDCTTAVLGKNKSFETQLIYGQEHWLRRIEKIHYMVDVERCGMAIGDVNGDSLEDVYLCQGGGLPNRLFVQNSDNTATDRSAQSGTDWLDHTNSALLVDLDNDGDQDLVLAVPARVLVMENDSTGVFQLATELPTDDEDTEALSAVDYDGDGDLDLYVCTYYATDEAHEDESRRSFLYHDANNGGANLLFRNESTADRPWKFTDMTASVGLDENNRRYSLAASWEDYDNDGDPDLYVANDYGQNCLYRNDAGQFTDVAIEAGVVDHGSGMSVSWGDFDHDGFMDLYVANMFSSAGNRITRQARFRRDMDEASRQLYQRFAKGNSLFKNEGGKFREVSDEASVELGRWAWSSPFVDLNNDGWEDLFVANGYFTTEDTGDL
ncbi:MAG: hypothetical protein CMJ62_12730 [Planctomycetaceae bacterium]|nr:hypothetical protein [Planctomycetaceae bacterium]